MFHQLEVQNSLPLLQHSLLQAVVQVSQPKEALRNNQLLHRMITKEEDCLLSKTRKMSHQVVVLRSSQRKMMDKRTHQKEQRQQVL
jgi:hypothetical protein